MFKGRKNYVKGAIVINIFNFACIMLIANVTLSHCFSVWVLFYIHNIMRIGKITISGIKCEKMKILSVIRIN